MSPFQLFEPTYNSIKWRLMLGAWLPGERLELARLAAELGVSISPIRDSLNRLAGEQMIDASAGAGFHVPAIREQGVADMLNLNALLLRSAIGHRRDNWDAYDDVSTDHATRSAHLFSHIARHSGNAEIMQCVQGLNERLHWLRSLEPSLFQFAEPGLEDIKLALAEQAPADTLDMIVQDYHARCVQGSARYVHEVTRLKAQTR